MLCCKIICAHKLKFEKQNCFNVKLTQFYVKLFKIKIGIEQ